jgi:hypothetical protein
MVIWYVIQFVLKLTHFRLLRQAQATIVRQYIEKVSSYSRKSSFVFCEASKTFNSIYIKILGKINSMPILIFLHRWIFILHFFQLK